MYLLDINERVRELRENIGLSRRAFGERLGVSESVIVNIEYGRLRRPDQKESLYKLICKEFNVNELWLKTGEGEPFEQNPELDEEAEYVEELLNNKDDEFCNAIRALMKVYFRMDDKSKAVFKQAGKDWITEMNKGQD